MYDVRAYPTSFLIDGEGKVVGKAVGAREWASKDSFDLINTYWTRKKRIRKSLIVYLANFYKPIELHLEFIDFW